MQIHIMRPQTSDLCVFERKIEKQTFITQYRSSREHPVFFAPGHFIIQYVLKDLAMKGGHYLKSVLAQCQHLTPLQSKLFFKTHISAAVICPSFKDVDVFTADLDLISSCKPSWSYAPTEAHRLLVKPQTYLFNSSPALVENVTEEKICRLFKMTQLLFSERVLNIRDTNQPVEMCAVLCTCLLKAIRSQNQAPLDVTGILLLEITVGK